MELREILARHGVGESVRGFIREPRLIGAIGLRSRGSSVRMPASGLRTARIFHSPFSRTKEIDIGIEPPLRVSIVPSSLPVEFSMLRLVHVADS